MFYKKFRSISLILFNSRFSKSGFYKNFFILDQKTIKKTLITKFELVIFN